jgi:hypothetical protein
MEEKETERADLERLCQGVSPNDEPCDYPATVQCETCRKWFCDAHAEDEEWHRACCRLEKRAARHRAPSIRR